jgi:FKBP-type peptidyl-prolyl cis-trans isomerase FkpA
VAETRPHQRVVALIIAVLFFGFSFAASFAVIYQLYKDNKDAKVVEDKNTANLNTQSQQQSANKLKGTKLANFTPVSKVDTLQVTDTKVGDGTEVKAGDYVTVDYTGALAETGVIFESSLDSGQPVSFSLNGVIQGWTDGILGMKIGGTRRLIIPAAQAYGDHPREGSGIPKNAPLVFDVTLHSIGQ